VLRYEIVSIKPDRSDARSAMVSTPDGLTAKNVSVRTLIQNAYDVRFDQVSGGPAWLSSESYDVDAKMEASVADAFQKLSRTDRVLVRQHMLQEVLADRLKLEVRRETKELPTYSLVVVKGGSRLKEASPGDTYPNGLRGSDGTSGAGLIRTIGVRGGQTTTAQGVSIANLVRFLTGFLDRPVLDKTGLSGNYDFILSWSVNGAPMQSAPADLPLAAPDPPPPYSSGPSLFQALQEQLGLKLDAGKGPVEMIVIVHVERPSEN
jgi:uncharacterized protein (TIGR03435 family)